MSDNSEERFDATVQKIIDGCRREGDHVFCEFCDGRYSTKGIAGHIRNRHPGRVSAMVDHPDLGSEAYDIVQQAEKAIDEEKVVAAEGMAVTDNTEYDYLAFPRGFKERIEAAGAKLHWAAPDKVMHYKNQGFDTVSVDRKTQNQMAHHGNREDTTLRTNELVAMVVPRDVKERREQLRKIRRDAQADGLATSDKSGALDDVGEAAYQYFRKNYNMSRDDAMMHARRAEKGAYDRHFDREPGEMVVRHRR